MPAPPARPRSAPRCGAPQAGGSAPSPPPWPPAPHAAGRRGQAQPRLGSRGQGAGRAPRSREAALTGTVPLHEGGAGWHRGGGTPSVTLGRSRGSPSTCTPPQCHPPSFSIQPGARTYCGTAGAALLRSRAPASPPPASSADFAPLHMRGAGISTLGKPHGLSSAPAPLCCRAGGELGASARRDSGVPVQTRSSGLVLRRLHPKDAHRTRRAWGCACPAPHITPSPPTCCAHAGRVPPAGRTLCSLLLIPARDL